MLYINEILSATKTRLLASGTAEPVRSFAIDSRKVVPGACFIALQGTRIHGGKFIEQAFRQGATAVLVDRTWIHEQRRGKHASIKRYHNVIVADDVKSALWSLACFYRSRLKPRVVGITGSSGKTSTKEILRQVLTHFYRVHASPLSFNNDLGTPLTVLELDPAHEVYIQELGASEKNSIRRLAELILPEAGVITGIGIAHLKGFGSVEGIYDAKLELAEVVSGRGGAIIYDGDNKKLRERIAAYHVTKISFGEDRSSFLRFSKVKHTADGYHFTVDGKGEFFIPTHAAFQIKNTVAALGVIQHLGIDPAKCREILKNIKWPPGRFSVAVQSDGITIIDDTYNANPTAFQASLSSFSALALKRRVVVCGDMLELGEESAKYHVELGKEIGRMGTIDVVVCVGAEARQILKGVEKENGGISGYYFDSTAKTSEFLHSFLKSGDGVLIKGSRGMHMEEIVEELRACFTLSVS